MTINFLFFKRGNEWVLKEKWHEWLLILRGMNGFISLVLRGMNDCIDYLF